MVLLLATLCPIVCWHLDYNILYLSILFVLVAASCSETIFCVKNSLGTRLTSSLCSPCSPAQLSVVHREALPGTRLTSSLCSLCSPAQLSVVPREARPETRLTGRRVSDTTVNLFAKWMQVMCTGLKMVGKPSVLQLQQLLTLVSVFTASRTQTAGLNIIC